MNQLKLFLIGLLALYSTVESKKVGKIINCYWGTWANYRPAYGAFKPENIDPKLCTHLSYSFFGINEDGEVKTLDGWLDLDSGLGNIKKAIALKTINPDLKVMLVVGGWNEGSAKYSQMAADPAKRKTFIRSVLRLIQQHKFDGLDLDWEYPTSRDGGRPEDKANFVKLLKEIYQALHPRNLEFGIAVGASVPNTAVSYELPMIAQYVDFINVMTYDYVTWNGGVVGYNAPLRGQGVNNVEASIKHWLAQGVPASKLVLGLALYGHTFQLANPQQYSLGSPVVGPGTPGAYTQEPGYLGYNEICTMQDSWNYQWAEAESVPLLRKSNEFISYDNPESIGLKVDLANSLKLGGVMTWAIETDDFHGLCGTKYPLLKTINNKMGNPQDMSTSSTERKASEKPTDSKPHPPNGTIDSGDCSVDGFLPNKSDCSKFYQCVGGVRHLMSCPSGLDFDVSISSCNWPQLVKCFQ